MKILVADDESIIRMGLRAMLEGMGHTAILARDGHDAMQKALSHKPDLAILDIQMPKTNGLQLARALNKHFPIPIIFLTAYSQSELIEKATDLNVQGYLIKPVQPASLQAAIIVAAKRFKDQQAEMNKRVKAEQKLESRKLIDRAKAQLMQGDLSEEEAYLLIQKQARESNRPMGAVAKEILNG